MALVRGKFGIEYNPTPLRDNRSPFGPIVGGVLLLALISYCGLRIYRWASHRAEERETARLIEVTSGPTNLVAAIPQIEPTPPRPTTPPPAIQVKARELRPQKLNNLLLRLDTTMARGDVVMSIDTIEQIRDQYRDGAAADLDDNLARKLGDLNFKWLFELKNAQWTTEITVGHGDSASRIASEHGSTLASFTKLNGLVRADTIRLGQRLHVIHHPRFKLAIHKRTRIADLELNGKFFKRYDLTAPVTGQAGTYQTSAGFKRFLAENGIWLSTRERDELEMLLPRGTLMVISDL